MFNFVDETRNYGKIKIEKHAFDRASTMKVGFLGLYISYVHIFQIESFVSVI